MNQAQWTAETVKMQHAYGAPITDDEVKQIGAYLAVAYGPAMATDAAILAASAPATQVALTPASQATATKPDTSAPTACGPAVDIQALLNANACLSCHTIAQKIVGPSYQDVSARYKRDAQALGKLEASIRQGSVGKWGDAPMPPYRAE